MDLEDVLTRCRNARFTGVLHVRSREADGEIWLLSGIADATRFGADAGDMARQRMARATDVAFELVPRLPGVTGGFKTRLDVEGPLGEATPVALMRHCEAHAITCELHLVFGNATVRACYADGELGSIESSSPSEPVATLLESHEGRYRFVLPPPPEGIPIREPGKSSRPPPAMEQATPDSLEVQAAAAGKRNADEEAAAKREPKAEAKRKPKPASAPKPTSTPMPARRSKRALWIIAAILVAAAVAGSVYMRIRHKHPTRSYWRRAFGAGADYAQSPWGEMHASAPAGWLAPAAIEASAALSAGQTAAVNEPVTWSKPGTSPASLKRPSKVPVTFPAFTAVICTFALVAAHELMGLHDPSKAP